MADRTEIIALLPHPIDYSTKEPVINQDSRTEGQMAGQNVWKVWATVPWSDFANSTLTMPRNGPDKPAIGSYAVELNRGNAKRGKEGSSNDYDYFWNAISWKLLEIDAPEDREPTPTVINSAAPAIGSNNSYATGQAHKNRAVALSYANDAFIGGKIERSEVFEVATKYLEFVELGPEAVMEEE